MANPKELYSLKVGSNQVALVRRQKDNIDQINEIMGWTEVTGDLPENIAIVAEGISGAMERGCFPVAITYRISPTKKQRTIMLCSPEKADTALDNLIGKTYAGKRIVKATPVRRVSYEY
ncbi:hypothetical protein ACE1CI_00795 [Aerosakkonemataceae cyanobacterium BLCC-F50]|uniref:Uncharacterized protein n=1 Tax=Floridaenema flaviceps BLCC-F50 TaxID=3153642 RepID=A0ABV4XJ59_9CYAN